MKFFSVFLKVVSLIVVIASTLICTAICVNAAVIEAYIIMGLAWI